MLEFDFHQVGNIGKGNLTDTDSSNPGRAAHIGINQAFHLPDFHIHHIAEDLAPHIRPGSGFRHREICFLSLVNVRLSAEMKSLR